MNNLILAGEVFPCGKNRMIMRVISDYLLYGTSFSEYFAYRFYILNSAEKKNYMTRRHMFSFFDCYNEKEKRQLIGDKRIAYQHFGDLLKRESFPQGLYCFL